MNVLIALVIAVLVQLGVSPETCQPGMVAPDLNGTWRPIQRDGEAFCDVQHTGDTITWIAVHGVDSRRIVITRVTYFLGLPYHSTYAERLGVVGTDMGQDGLNAAHKGRPVAVFHYEDGIGVYGIDPYTGDGVYSLFIDTDAIERAEYDLLGSGINAVTGWPIDVYRLPDGQFQLNTYYPDGKPYTITWGVSGVQVVAW